MNAIALRIIIANISPADPAYSYSSMFVNPRIKNVSEAAQSKHIRGIDTDANRLNFFVRSSSV